MLPCVVAESWPSTDVEREIGKLGLGWRHIFLGLLCKVCGGFFRMSRSSVARFNSSWRHRISAYWSADSARWSRWVVALKLLIQAVGTYDEVGCDLDHWAAALGYLFDCFNLELCGEARLAHDTSLLGLV